MANYEPSARTNYFRVKNLKAFREFLSTIPGIELITREAKKGYVGLLFEGGIPSCRTLCRKNSKGEEADDIEEIDFAKELAAHLHKNSVAVLMEVGHENLRYVIGIAIAVNARGQTLAVDLHAIYGMAKRKFRKAEITHAEY